LEQGTASTALFSSCGSGSATVANVPVCAQLGRKLGKWFSV